MIEGVVGLTVMMALAFLRVPIAYAMGIVGVVGYAYMRDWNWAVAFAMTQTKLYETGRSYTLSVVPLFILMGNFVTRAGMSRELFRAAYAFIGHLRGGLAMATTIMVIYGVFTETNIGKLFMAGILPGILGALLLCLAIVYMTWREPGSGPPGPRSTWRERGLAVKDVWGVAALFLFVMGGIYGGLFTATEGAGMGAAGAMVFALWRGALTLKTLYAALLESARTTAMLFLILIGALMFAEFVNITTMPADLKALVSSLGLSPIMVVAAICAIYVVLGTAMEELSMILLTMPVFFPVIVQLGFDPVWFGIIIVCVVEIGLISPPVGMNMFVLKTLLPEVSTGTVFSGVMPFMWADVIRLAILVAFPAISLWLPSLMR